VRIQYRCKRESIGANICIALLIKSLHFIQKIFSPSYCGQKILLYLFYEQTTTEKDDDSFVIATVFLPAAPISSLLLQASMTVLNVIVFCSDHTMKNVSSQNECDVFDTDSCTHRSGYLRIVILPHGTQQSFCLFCSTSFPRSSFGMNQCIVNTTIQIGTRCVIVHH